MCLDGIRSARTPRPQAGPQKGHSLGSRAPSLEMRLLAGPAAEESLCPYGRGQAVETGHQIAMRMVASAPVRDVQWRHESA